MSSNLQSGSTGEDEIVEKIPCPNCSKKLMKLPTNFPLYDVQCTGCSFRAQVKTNNSKPKPEIFGAGWEIMNKVLKAGFLAPPLIVNFKWKVKGKSRQEIRYYPFIPKSQLRKYPLRRTKNIKNTRKTSKVAYWMFNYTDIDKIPYMPLCIKNGNNVLTGRSLFLKITLKNTVNKTGKNIKSNRTKEEIV